MVAHREAVELAKQFIEKPSANTPVPAGQFNIHTDRGRMTSKPVAFLMADLGVTKTHSRPYVSDGNPLFGKLLPHHEIPSRVPRPLRPHPRQPRLLSAIFPGTTKSTIIPGSACSPRPWLTSPSRLGPPPSWCSMLVTKRTRSASFGGLHNHCLSPRRSGTTASFFTVRPEKGARSHSPGRLASVPSRLPEQPFFYPVLHEEYATQIARDWNTKNGGTGYVVRLYIEKSFLDRYQGQTAGARIHREYLDSS